MASKNVAVIELVGDNANLRRALNDSERRTRGLEKQIGRMKGNSKGAFSPLTESALKSLGPLEGVGKKLAGLGTKFKETRLGSKMAGSGIGNLAGALGGLGKAAGIAGLAIAATVGAAIPILKTAVDRTMALAGATRQLNNVTHMGFEQSSAWVGILKYFTNVSVEKAQKGFATLGQKIHVFNEGGKGAKKVTDVFDSLGVSANTLASGNFSAVLGGVADGIKAMGPGTEAATAATALFGRAGLGLLPILLKGKKGIAELTEKLKEHHLTINDKTLKDTKALKMQQANLNMAMDGFYIMLGKDVIPLLNKAIPAFTGFVDQLISGKGPADSLAGTLRGVASAISDAIGFIGSFLDLPFVGTIVEWMNPITRFGDLMGVVFG